MDSESTSAGRGWGLLIVLVACAVVAVGASETGLTGIPREFSASQLQTFRIAGLVVAALGLVTLLFFGRPGKGRGARREDRVSAALSRAAVILLVLAWIAFLGPRPEVPAGPPEEPDPGGRLTENPDAPMPALPPPPNMRGSDRPRMDGSAEDEATEFQEAPAEEEPEPPTPPQPAEEPLFSAESILGLLLLLAILGLGLTFVRRRGAVVGLDDEDESWEEVAADAAAGLEASLARVHFAEGDPRGQITLAYSELLAALEDAGAPRQPYQAPHEHLYQVLGPLGVRPEPLHELTSLYVLAQFSERPVTGRHRERAVDALERSLHDLRAAVGGRDEEVAA